MRTIDKLSLFCRILKRGPWNVQDAISAAESETASSYFVAQNLQSLAQDLAAATAAAAQQKPRRPLLSSVGLRLWQDFAAFTSHDY